MTKSRNIHEVKLDIRPNGLLCVPVKINGQGPYSFILDTGGGYCISHEVAHSLQLKRLDWANEHMHTTIVSVAVESVRCSGQLMYIRDCSDFSRIAQGQVDGMLGHEFLKLFHTTINYPKQTLILEAFENMEGEFNHIAADYNRRGNWHDILQRLLGWKLISQTEAQQGFKIPGASRYPWEAVFDYDSGQLHVGTVNQTFFEPGKGYSPFAIYAHIKHNGNFADAAKDLAAQGFGFQHETQSGEKKSSEVEMSSDTLHADMSNHLAHQSTAIQLQLMDSIPFVPVTVDEQGPFLFLLDTGATGDWQRISPVVANTLQIDPDSPRDVTIAIGSAKLENLPASLTDCSHIDERLKDHGYLAIQIDGYIGYNFLREFVVTINYRSRTLTLARS